MRTLAILVTGLLVAACGGSAISSGTNPTTGPGVAATNAPVINPPTSTFDLRPPDGVAADPCALLTNADIEEATGRKVETMRAGPVMGIFANGCTWELAFGGDDMVPVSIELGVISPGGLQYYETYLKPYDATPIAGIGDDAVTHDAGGISAVKGDTLVSVFVIAFGDDEEAFTRELTQAVLSRVP